VRHVRELLCSPAQADGYCAAQCLDDAATGYNARYSKCFISASGIDTPDQQTLATYVAAKIRSGPWARWLSPTKSPRLTRAQS
jgi:hypothetical protein